MFAIRPYGSANEIFLLPDGHGALEGVNRIAAGIERRRPVRGTHRDQHAGLADFKTAEAVNDREPIDRELGAKLSANLAHFRVGHRLHRPHIRDRAFAAP